MESKARGLALRLSDEKILKKILYLFITVTVVLLIQGVYNLYTMDQVTVSIKRMFNSMDRLHKVSIDITQPINNLLQLSMTHVMAPNRKIAAQVKAEMDESVEKINKAIEEWEEIAKENGQEPYLRVIRAEWSKYLESMEKTVFYVQQQIRAAAFISNTGQEKQQHLKLLTAVKRLDAAQISISDKVHHEAVDGSEMAYWVALITTTVEVIILKIITIIVVNMVSNYIENKKINDTQLNERRKFFETLINNIPGTFFRVEFSQDKQGRLSFITDNIVNLCGLEAEKFTKHGFEVYEDLITKESKKSDLVSLRNKIATGYRNAPRNYELEYEIRSKNGDLKYVSEVGSLLEMTEIQAGKEVKTRALIGFIFDMTELEQSKRILVRTSEQIRTILNNVKFGFFLADRSGYFQGECSESCYKLFNTDSFEGKHFIDFLDLEFRERESFIAFYDQIWEDVFPEEVSLAQLNTDYRIGGKTLRIEGKVVRNSDNQIVNVLFSVADVSNEKVALGESHKNELLLNILKEKEAFVYFLESLKEYLSDCRSYIETDDMVSCKRALHAIKGNTMSYNLENISNQVHEIEGKEQIQTYDIDNIETSVSQFVKDHEYVLGINYSQLEHGTFSLNEDHLSELDKKIRHLPLEHQKEIRSWMMEVTRIPASSLIGPIEQHVKVIAERLDKDIEFELYGNNVLVYPDMIRGVLRNLSHLVRNSIDHGIEREGKLEVTLHDDGSHYLIEVADDGEGIDTKLIVKKALKNQLVSASEVKKMSERERQELIFIDSLSSAQKVTSVSGRGIGMSSIKNEVERVGGTMKLCESTNAGTKFIIKIGYLDYLNRRNFSNRAG